MSKQTLETTDRLLYEDHEIVVGLVVEIKKTSILWHVFSRTFGC